MNFFFQPEATTKNTQCHYIVKLMFLPVGFNAHELPGGSRGVNPPLWRTNKGCRFSRMTAFLFFLYLVGLLGALCY